MPARNTDRKRTKEQLPSKDEKIDEHLMRRLRIEKNLSHQEVSDLMKDTSRTEVQRIEATGKIKRFRLRGLASALGTLPETLLLSSNLGEEPEQEFKRPIPNHWDLIEWVSDTSNAPNGVAYRVAKLQSKLLPAKFARGKFYEMHDVASAQREELRERLIRHPSVCEALERSGATRIAKHGNIVPLSNDTAWWILDDWIDGTTLRELIDDKKTFCLSDIKRIGAEILAGLQELHDQKIVFRELSPDRIYFSEDFARCTLTDFELAKILKEVPTVSGKWLTRNPYRAPEQLKNNTIAWSNYARTDIFSWAAIIAELFTGSPEADDEEMVKIVADEALSKLLIACRSPVFKERPVSIKDVQVIWNR